MDINELFDRFLAQYDTKKMDQVWAKQSETFRQYWNQNIKDASVSNLDDDGIDKIVRILDRNGKGNTKESQAVARAMVAQGAWRRMFRELCSDKSLGGVVTKILTANNPDEQAKFIDELYEMNAGRKNNLTGPSGNVINAMLAAYDPENNLSMISLNDRLHLIEYLRFPLTMDIENASQGFRTVSTSETIIEGFKSLGIIGSARTLSCFCYHSDVKALWKISSKIRREDKEVEVSVPTDDHDSNVEEHDDGPRESIVIQAIVAEIGERMGLKIWLPRSDRSRVLQKWQPEEGSLIEVLPLNYGDIAMKTIENIDVLWIKKRTIVRAFEVEHTTSIYSGLLRMADLLALLPNIDINLHIVAPSSRRDKVFEEIRRPVFSLLEGGALSEKCTYISYDNLQELSSERNLEFLKNEVLDKYSEAAE